MNQQSTFNMYKGTRQFFGVEGAEDASAAPADSKSIKDHLSEIKDKIMGGAMATIELIVYVVFLAHFVAILVYSQSVTEDGAIVQDKNNTAIQAVCGLGILLCLVRIGWSHVFFQRAMESETGRVIEMVFSILMFILFSTALGVSLSSRSALESATSSNLVTASKKHNKMQWILSSIGTGASGFYMGVNIYFVVKNKNAM
jgi:hypothetical protein